MFYPYEKDIPEIGAGVEGVDMYRDLGAAQFRIEQLGRELVQARVTIRQADSSQLVEEIRYYLLRVAL